MKDEGRLTARPMWASLAVGVEVEIRLRDLHVLAAGAHGGDRRVQLAKKLGILLAKAAADAEAQHGRIVLHVALVLAAPLTEVGLEKGCERDGVTKHIVDTADGEVLEGLIQRRVGFSEATLA